MEIDQASHIVKKRKLNETSDIKEPEITSTDLVQDLLQRLYNLDDHTIYKTVMANLLTITGDNFDKKSLLMNCYQLLGTGHLVTREFIEHKMANDKHYPNRNKIFNSENLLANIFEYLDANCKLVGVESTCHRWRYVSLNGHGWKYAHFVESRKMKPENIKKDGKDEKDEKDEKKFEEEILQLQETKVQTFEFSSEKMAKLQHRLVHTISITNPPLQRCCEWSPKWSWLSNLKSIKKVSISEIAAFSNTSILSLKSIAPQLEDLSLSESFKYLDYIYNDRYAEFLETCTKLKCLKLPQSTTTNVTLELLSKLTQLKELTLNNCQKVTASGLNHLPISLNIILFVGSGIKANKSTFEIMSRFVNLTKLDLWDMTFILKEDFEQLKHLCSKYTPRLELLTFSVIAYKDISFDELKNIQLIRISLSRPTRSNVTTICNLTNLCQLDLNKADELTRDDIITIANHIKYGLGPKIKVDEFCLSFTTTSSLDWNMIEPLTSYNFELSFIYCSNLRNVTRWHEFVNVKCLELSSDMIINIETIESIAKIPRLQAFEINGLVNYQVPMKGEQQSSPITPPLQVCGANSSSHVISSDPTIHIVTPSTFVNSCDLRQVCNKLLAHVKIVYLSD